MLLTKLFQNFVRNQIQIYVVVKLTLSATVDYHKVSSLRFYELLTLILLVKDNNSLKV